MGEVDRPSSGEDQPSEFFKRAFLQHQNSHSVDDNAQSVTNAAPINNSASNIPSQKSNYNIIPDFSALQPSSSKTNSAPSSSSSNYASIDVSQYVPHKNPETGQTSFIRTNSSSTLQQNQSTAPSSSSNGTTSSPSSSKEESKSSNTVGLQKSSSSSSSSPLSFIKRFSTTPSTLEKKQYQSIPSIDGSLSNDNMSSEKSSLSSSPSYDHSGTTSPSSTSSNRTSLVLESGSGDTMFPNLEGYLDKKGDVGVFKSWKRRFFCLREDRLIYKMDKSSPNVIGFIPLADAMSIEASSNSVGGFQINTKQRVWYIRAENKEEMEKWVKACRVHATFKEESLKFPTYEERRKRSLTRRDMVQKQGYLEKMHGNHWKARWFLLKDGILYKFKSKEDSSEWKLPLYHCTVEDSPETSASSFKITSHNKVVVLSAVNENEKREWMELITRHNAITEQIIDSSTQ